MQDRLRVLLLNWRDSGHPEGGGAESFCERVASGLATLGHEVTVRCARYPGAAADEIVDGVAYVRRGGRFTVYPRAALALARRRRGYDVVLDVQNGMPFWAPLFTRALVVNVTHHLHREQWTAVFGGTLGRVGWWLESRLAPRVYRRCRYLTVSAATRADLVAVGVDAARVGVVYSGLDAPVLPVDAAGWPRSPQPSVVVLGRLVPHKRVELAIDAVAALPGATLTVVGHGYWEPQLRAYAERLGVGDAVTFTGFVDDVTKHRLLAAAWVHALPSVKEGWSLRGGGERGARHADGGVPVRRRADRVGAGRGDRPARRRPDRLRPRVAPAAHRAGPAGVDGPRGPGARGPVQLAGDGGRGRGRAAHPDRPAGPPGGADPGPAPARRPPSIEVAG